MAEERATSRFALSAPIAALRGPEAAVAVCPFLGSLEQVADAGAGVAAYGEDNRCFAYGAPLPLGREQQELVCLTVEHAVCPRYIRGVRYGRAGPKRRRGLPRRLVGSIAGLVAFLILGVTLVSGSGLNVGPLAALIAGNPATPSPSLSSTPSPPPTATPEPTPTFTPEATMTPSPEPTPSPAPTASLPTPPPGSAYATLAPCPEGEMCYLYTVRSGDTLYDIARRFDTTLAALRALNPAIADTNIIRPGQVLKIPPP